MDLDFLTLASSSPDSEMDLMTIMMSMEKQLTDPNLASSSTGQTPILSDPMATYPGELSFTSDHFQQPPGLHHQASVAAMREMIFRIASMQPVHIDPETVKPLRRRNVKISKDPQSVAARHRRERISEKMRILQRLVPGGRKMDTASMLEEAIHYVKFLKTQVQSLEMAAASTSRQVGMGFPLPAAAAVAFASGNYSCYALQPPDQMYVNTSTNTHQMLR